MKRFISKYWKIVLAIAVTLIIVSAGTSIFKGVSTYISDFNRLKASYDALDTRETANLETIANQTEIIRNQDVRIDSLDLALSLKRERIIKIHSDVQLLRGDSVAIADNLARVYTRASDNSNL